MKYNIIIRHTAIGLCVLSAVAAASLTCFGQWGSNAPAYSDCCPCVPAQPWGYCQTRWHRWPGVMYQNMQVQGPPRGEGIAPPQTELPNPKSEGESKPEAATAPNQTTPQAAPEGAPSNPFQEAPRNQPQEGAPQQPTGTTAPSETAPGATEQGTTPPGESAPGTTEQGTTAPGEKEPNTTEPGANGPGMELPSTEPPKETPSAPADTSQPAPGELPVPESPNSNESTPKEQSKPEPDSGMQPSRPEPGAWNMSPGSRLRRGEAGTVGGQARSADPAPIMPAVCIAPARETSAAGARGKAIAREPVQAPAAKAAPALIAPAANAKRLEAPVAGRRTDGRSAIIRCVARE